MKKLILISFLFLSFFCQAQNYMMIDKTRASEVEIDTDFQAWLDEVDNEGYTAPSEDYQEGLNLLVIALKTAGVWSSLDLLYIPAMDTENATRVNLVDPENFQLTDAYSTTPTWVANDGVITNSSHASGGDGWYNSNWTPSTDANNYTQDGSCIGYFIGDGVGDTQPAGQYAPSTGRCMLYSTTVTKFYTRHNATGNASYDGIDHSVQSIMVTSNRTSSTLCDIYENTTVHEANHSSNGLSTNSVKVGAIGSNATSEAALTSAGYTVLRIVWLGGDMTSGEISDIYNAFDSYLQNYVF